MKLSRSVTCAAVSAIIVAACSSDATLSGDFDASIPDIDAAIDFDGSTIGVDSGATHADAGKDGGAPNTGEDSGAADSGTKDAGPPAPTCTDKIQNEGETDVDCGGTNCPKCPDTKKCSSGTDCTSGTCITGVCGEASCTDGVQDGTETAVDCGGGSCPGCADTMACKVGTDCTSGVCDPGALTCTPATCTDGVKNEGETAIDCGGPNCSPCPDGSTCATNTDCIDGVCNPGTMTCSAPTCSDGVMNEGETDIDCGGPHCSACPDGKMCATSTDCIDKVCAGTCQAPSCTDGVQNESETDVDCGGPNCGPCADGDKCSKGGDCVDGVCTGGKCIAPSCSDGKQNGAETGIDCGGGTCPRCDIGQGCSQASDCDYNVCTGAVCQNAVSCAANASGTDTCGAAGNDNCCATLPVPGGTIGTVGVGKTGWSVSPYKLDKYEITVGRMRAFLISQNWDLIDHAPAQDSGAHAKIPNSGWQSVWNNRLPKGQSNVLARAGIVGGNATQDSGTSGCYGGEDASTWTNTAGANDSKVANCFDWYTLQAFCIWDGGYLPTEREWQFAAQGGTAVRTFAWGNTPKDTDYMPGCNINGTGSPACTLDSNTYVGQGYTDAAGTKADGTYTFPTPPGEWVVHAFCENDGDRWCFSYSGANANANLGALNAAHVAPPGQKLDIALWGQYDMSGNLIEWTLDNSVNINAATGDQQVENACVGADCANVDWVVWSANPANKDPQGKAIVGDESVPGNPAYWRNYSYDTGGTGPYDLTATYQQDGGRVMRGGSWEIAHPINVSNRYGNYPVYRSYYAAGARCARAN